MCIVCISTNWNGMVSPLWLTSISMAYNKDSSDFTASATMMLSVPNLFVDWILFDCLLLGCDRVNVLWSKSIMHYMSHNRSHFSIMYLSWVTIWCKSILYAISRCQEVNQVAAKWLKKSFWSLQTRPVEIQNHLCSLEVLTVQWLVSYTIYVSKQRASVSLLQGWQPL